MRAIWKGSDLVSVLQQSLKETQGAKKKSTMEPLGRERHGRAARRGELLGESESTKRRAKHPRHEKKAA